MQFTLIYLTAITSLCLAVPLPEPAIGAQASSKLVGCIKNCFLGGNSAAKKAAADQLQQQQMAGYFAQMREQAAAAERARSSASAPISQMDDLNQNFDKVLDSIKIELARANRRAPVVQQVSLDPSFHPGGMSLEKSSRTNIIGSIPE